MKRALVIAGGIWQVPIIEYLHQHSYQVTVVNPYPDSPGMLKADDHIVLDVREKEMIWKTIQENHLRYDLVTTDQSDVSVETVAFIADKLGVPGNPIDVVTKYSNKYLSRQYAQSVGVPVPQFTSVSTFEEIERFIQQVGTPLIIKPCDSQSSKGIHKIEKNTTPEQLKEYLKDALQYSFVGKAILEQFVEGTEFTVDGFCANGKHQVLAISRKKHFKMGVASALTYPANLPEDIESRLIAVDNAYVEQSGLHFGPTHAEYIINEKTGEFYLVEIACRGGGSRISSDIVKWVSDFDVYEALLQCLEGKESLIDMKVVTPMHRSAELHFFDFGTGVITSIQGLDKLSHLEGVIAADFPYKEGDRIQSCQNDSSRQGYVIVFAENETQLQERLENIYKTFTIQLQ